MPDNTLAGGGITIRIDESADFRIIVAALEVIEPSLGIVIVATVAEGIDGCNSSGGGQHFAVGIVGITARQRTVSVQDHHHVALQVGHEIVHRAVVLHGVGSAVIGIEEVQNISGLIGTVVPNLPQQLAAGIGIDAGNSTNRLAGTHTAEVVDIADIGGAVGGGGQGSAVAPAHGPPGAVVIAGGIAGAIVGDGLAVVSCQQILPVGITVGVAVVFTVLGSSQDIAHIVIGVGKAGVGSGDAQQLALVIVGKAYCGSVGQGIAGNIAQSVISVVEIVIQGSSCDGIADSGHLSGNLGVGDIPVQVLPGQRTHGNRAEPTQVIVAETQGIAQSRDYRFFQQFKYTVKLPDFQHILKKSPGIRGFRGKVNKHR